MKNNVILAPLTTIKLGGKARYFIRCETMQDVKDSLQYAKENHIRTHILGGGSNTIFTGESFDGLVLKIDIKGTTFEKQDMAVIATAKAGEDWDPFVAATLQKGLAGLECLSGIPGSVGATPMQNVGAYGQSVAESIVRVEALNKETLETKTFTNEECLFDYRNSRFKYQDNDKYVITEVSYRLIPDGTPTIKYPELLASIQKDMGKLDVGQGKEALLAVREAVLQLRKKKSMVVDPQDPHSQSCGSFFMNVIVTNEKFAEMAEKWANENDNSIPHFPEDSKHTKIPAGWLVEKSGIAKGYRQGSVGVSPNHTLGLVNYGNDAKQLLELAEDVKEKVKEKFGVELQREPILVP